MVIKIKKQSKLKRFIILLVLFAIILAPIKVLAIDAEFYGSNNILFYNPDGEAVVCNSVAADIGITPEDNKIPYDLPATSGKTGVEEAIDNKGQVLLSGKTITFHTLAETLPQAYRDYYITMRWNYVSWNWDGETRAPVDNKQINWFTDKPRIILVTNPKTGKSVNVAALESGPAPWVGVQKKSEDHSIPLQGWVNPQKGTPDTYTGLVSGMPPKAIDALGGRGIAGYGGKGDILTYQWATDQSVIPGPTDAIASGGCVSGISGPGKNGWELTGPNAMVFYNQWDKEWATKIYGGGTIKDCACGPTSLAMIAATLNNDKTINPENVAKFYADIGGQADGCPSYHKWDDPALELKYNIKATNLNNDLSKAKEVLKRGGLVLFGWQGSPFSSGGHIMVMRKYTDDGKIYIASSGPPPNKEQSETAWDESIFKLGYNGPAVSNRGTTGNLGHLWGIEKK